MAPLLWFSYRFTAMYSVSRRSSPMTVLTATVTRTYSLPSFLLERSSGSPGATLDVAGYLSSIRRAGRRWPHLKFWTP